MKLLKLGLFVGLISARKREYISLKRLLQVYFQQTRKELAIGKNVRTILTMEKSKMQKGTIKVS